MKRKFMYLFIAFALNASILTGCASNSTDDNVSSVTETDTEENEQSVEEYVLGKEFTLKLNEKINVDGCFDITLVDRYSMYDGGEEGKTEITVDGETYVMYIGLSENNGDKHYPRMEGNTVLPYSVEVKKFTDNGPVVVCNKREFPEPLVLSGNAEDIIVTDDYEYVIGEKCNIFIDKGCTISGDTLTVIENVMTELENETGLKFNNSSVYTQCPDDLGRGYFDAEYWNDYNRYGKDNINIYLINLPEGDTRISCADRRCCVLMNDDYNFKEYGISTMAHEISHVLQRSNFDNFDDKLSEGFAVYWSLKMIDAFPEYRLPEDSENKDETPAYYHFNTEPLNGNSAENLYMKKWDRMDGNQPYEYGFGLMTYLYETYSVEEVNEFFEVLSKRLMDIRLADPTGEILWNQFKFPGDYFTYEIDAEELKKYFGDEILTLFGKWYEANEKRFMA